MQYLPHRFSLRAMLCFTAIVLCSVGYFSNAARTFRAEQALLDKLKKADKIEQIYYADGHPKGGIAFFDAH